MAHPLGPVGIVDPNCSFGPALDARLAPHHCLRWKFARFDYYISPSDWLPVGPSDIA